MSEFDYIVVGAGSAGCAVAARLSESGRHSVLLLEAGPDDRPFWRNFWLRVPVGYGRTFYDPRVNWMYMTEPVASAGGRESYWPRGKVLGGSSSINAMVYVRGQREDFDAWRDAGNPGWGFDDVLPTFKRMEAHAWGESDWHGGSGPIGIMAPSSELHPTCETFFRACEEAGETRNADFNGETSEGVGPYHLTIKDGQRMSASRGYLWPARNRKTLKIETGAAVQRILFNGNRATGIAYRRNGSDQRATARAEVIVCAGAIGSPQILMLSGLGPVGALAGHGISAIADLPGVGANLQDHYDICVFYRSTVPTLNDRLYPWYGKLWAGLQYVLTRKGPLGLSLNQAGGFVRTNAHQSRPNVQIYFSPLSYLKAPPGTRPLMNPDPYSAFQMSATLCRPTSRGRLELRSGDPAASPVIHPGYLETGHDQQEAIAGLRFLMKLAETAALSTIIEAPVDPYPADAGNEALLAYACDHGGTVFHPAGTCGMGPDPKQHVVDATLKVHGIRCLRIADASIFPTLTSGNTNAPAMMVGEKASDLILADSA